MLPNKQLHFLIFLFSLLSSYSLKAQLPGECPNLFFNQGCINGLTPDGTPCSLPLNTTADFLNFINDARAGGMGNAAIAVSPDVNAMQYNASKLVMHEKPASVAVNYGQFISDFRSGGDYFNYFSIAAYDRINEKQSIGIDWRFASSQFFNPILSTVTFDEDLHYTEYQIAVAYSRLINSKFSIGITPKLIRSRSDFSFFSAAVTENTNLAFDFSSTYRNKACLFDGSTDLTIGLALSNLGPKLKYESNTHESFLPANIGLGIALDTRLSDLSRLAFTLDVNKLMVPTPEIF